MNQHILKHRELCSVARSPPGGSVTSSSSLLVYTEYTETIGVVQITATVCFKVNLKIGIYKTCCKCYRPNAHWTSSVSVVWIYVHRLQ